MKIETYVKVTDPDLNWVREKIEAAGTQIGSVHFRKRADNTLRKMCYRLHVKNPTVANVPVGIKKPAKVEPAYHQVIKDVLVCEVCKKEKKVGGCWGPFILKQVTVSVPVDVPVDVPVVKATTVPSKKDVDAKNDQMTVLDVNKVVYKDGAVVGRGAWRTIPLENVERICNKGTTYVIQYSTPKIVDAVPKVTKGTGKDTKDSLSALKARRDSEEFQKYLDCVEKIKNDPYR